MVPPPSRVAVIIATTVLSCSGNANVASTTSKPSPPPESSPAPTLNPNDLDNSDKTRFLDKINDLCGDTYCEGEFQYDFVDLECDLSKSVCAIAFVMVTTAAVRDGLSPRRVRADGNASPSPVSGVIVRVIPPPECDANPDFARDDGPCTAIQAACFLSPIRSRVEFETLHWDKLSDCVLELEQAILPQS